MLTGPAEAPGGELDDWRSPEPGNTGGSEGIVGKTSSLVLYVLNLRCFGTWQKCLACSWIWNCMSNLNQGWMWGFGNQQSVACNTVCTASTCLPSLQKTFGERSLFHNASSSVNTDTASLSLAPPFLFCSTLSPQPPWLSQGKLNCCPLNIAVTDLFLQRVRLILCCCLNPETQDCGWPALLKAVLSRRYRIGEKLKMDS